MSQSDGEGEDVLAVLDDEYATEILVETYTEPRSACRLAELCDASRSTVYRRIERLQTHDLLETRQQLDPDGLEVSIDHTEEDAASRFTGLYEEFTGES
ncbi:winged helix-turn-helix domain-containing protein [Halorientalis regularis]|jgi:predicted transcriptional regulator|uniref:Helix-turn-helix domain-containing protein n=1 Tax=Halorientalis regularis TaxID=660518 RepID=A0A1G7S5T4_9EURY|nr:winged helix-turn-helix domain-containing protein [Halorientalis regularis]SDG18341.1 Helix-turn-helix domain-containing protein [Halorientalis regularis]